MVHRGGWTGGDRRPGGRRDQHRYVRGRPVRPQPGQQPRLRDRHDPAGDLAGGRHSLAFGFHAQPTTLILGFNVPLDPSRAKNVFNYRLVRLDSHGRPSGPIPITVAIYDGATNTVTLHPAQRLYLFGRHELTVSGAIPNGLTDTSGVYLGGTRVVAPGKNYLRVFGPEILGGVNAARSIRPDAHRLASTGQARHLAYPAMAIHPVWIHRASLTSPVSARAAVRLRR